VRRTTLFALLLAVAACRAPGYRDPDEAAAARRSLSDRTIETRVRVVLGEDPETAPYPAIRVESRDGVVTLRGAVDREGVRRRAEDLAAGCAGVRLVRNEIDVR